MPDPLTPEQRLQQQLDDATEHLDKVTDAVNALLDVVQRPVGTRDFTVPKTPEAGRAITGLYDAIGRNL